MAVVIASKPVQVGVLAVLALLLFGLILRSSGGSQGVAPWAYKGHSNVQHSMSDEPGGNGGDGDGDAPPTSPALADSDADAPNEDFAYATFLAIREDAEKPEKDPYFVAVRTLIYQLLHHPKTKGGLKAPLLVLAPPHTHQPYLDSLVEEGAQVLKVDKIDLHGDFDHGDSGLKASTHFARLHMWELDDYKRILYIDAGTLVMRSLDDIWDDKMVNAEMRALGKIEAHESWAKVDVVKPERYFMAGVSDAKDQKHPFPPPDSIHMSPAFYMLKPDEKVFKYYDSLLKKEDSFEREKLMSGLLSRAHRKDGPMPWRSFEAGKWNVDHPGKQDVDGGTATLSYHFWEDKNRDWLPAELKEMWWRIQGQMEGFWVRRSSGTP